MNTKEATILIEDHKLWLQHGDEHGHGKACAQDIFHALDMALRAMNKQSWAEELAAQNRTEHEMADDLPNNRSEPTARTAP